MARPPRPRQAEGSRMAVRVDGARRLRNTVLADNGQLGRGADISCVPARVPGLRGVRQVCAGSLFSVALSSTGRVWTWGAGGCGQLGNGINTGSSDPVAATFPVAPAAPAARIYQVACGDAHVLALAQVISAQPGSPKKDCVRKRTCRQSLGAHFFPWRVLLS